MKVPYRNGYLTVDGICGCLHNLADFFPLCNELAPLKAVLLVADSICPNTINGCDATDALVGSCLPIKADESQSNEDFCHMSSQKCIDYMIDVDQNGRASTANTCTFLQEDPQVFEQRITDWVDHCLI